MPIQPSSPILRHELVGEGLGAVELLRRRGHLGGREVAHGLLEQAVVVGEVEVHGLAQ